MSPIPRILTSLAMASLVLACPQGRITEPIASLPFATASPGCGPADGPAVEITLASANDPSAVPHVRVVLYESLDRLTRRWTLGEGAGFASYVTSLDHEESASSGTVEIERVDSANKVTGTVHLVFPHAGIIRGRFQAAWVPRLMLCG